ncbi:CAZyme family GH47 [Paecilomyces variotii]|nr:CAZyme family GH47 [Paecilomyces variotii]KAJ9238966.1 CAZyme family GH47 [Paecilomyces variotii]KAJ9256746.1 CAZyme family GH47 [Paecilomyces variotii]KAJ9287498.1 CAZyme family GH47 [Paecilomyces variotii]KAJ9307737.1 CAZyme family GH47 [Paecilomyces variotii]
MLFVRKNVVIATFVLIFLVYILFHRLPPGADVSNTEKVEAQSTKTDPIVEETVHWKHHPDNYPVSSYIPLPTGNAPAIPKIQYDFPRESAADRKEREHRQAAVKKAFQHAWNGYKEHAWLKDELVPITGLWRNTFSGWAATLVDTLDSLIIMGLDDDFEQALAALDKIDFTTTQDTQLNVFETTIRYVGGFLGAYDLSGGKHPILLQKAQQLGEMLYKAFDTPNRMPQSRWDWMRSAVGLDIRPSRNTLLAELGSLSMEFTRLTQLTGDPKFFDAVQRVTNVLEDHQKTTRLPGLWPVMVDAQHLDFSDRRFTIGGMADSTYEYLPKEYLLLGGRLQQYKNMYQTAMDQISNKLLYRPMTKNGEDVLIAGNTQVSVSTRIGLEPQAQHLTCFIGGMVGIGARIFDRPEELATARKLTDGCIWAYDSMPTGLMPEIFYTSVCSHKEDCDWDEMKWYHDIRRHFSFGGTESDEEAAVEAKKLIEEHGLQPGITEVKDSRYILRPEAIESVFIMYRITGDKKYQDAAWRMFQSIDNLSKTDIANAGITDVRSRQTGKSDKMESFWLAETLKYFYLVFSEPDVVSLDEYVLNTEAHPFKRPSPSA